MAFSNLRALAAAALLALPALAAKPAEKSDKPKPAAKANTEAVAIVGTVEITNAQVEERAATQLAQLRQQEYTLRESTTEALIADEIVKQAAAAKGLSSNQYLQAEVDAKVAPVTEQEKKDFYEKNKAQAGTMPEEEALKRIEAFLKRQRTDERRNALLAELRAATKVRTLIEPPRKAVEAIGPSRGPVDAPITIVEFSDFQCPYCSRVKGSIDAVMARYGKNVRLVFRDLPLPMHPNAPKAAEAGECAQEQGKFWELHDKMFADQNALAPENLKKSAAEIGLNAAAFNECLDSGKHAANVKLDADAAQALGVNGTPAFFVNGRFLNGAVPVEQFSKVIDDELQRKGLPIPPPQTAAASTPQS